MKVIDLRPRKPGAATGTKPEDKAGVKNVPPAVTRRFKAPRTESEARQAWSNLFSPQTGV